jgi:2-dehydropantoate 2-reductase
MDDGAWRFAVLGPGGIGGLLAGVLARQGHEVVCLAGDATAAHLAEHGLRVRSTVFGDFEVGVRAATRLDEPVDACIVAVKAYQLEDALERVEPEALGEGLVVPFLNGVEHVQVLRGRYPGAQVVPASIAVEAFKAGPATERSDAVHGRPPEGWIEQRGPFTIVELAAEEATRERVEALAGMLAKEGAQVRVREDGDVLLWDKLVPLGPLALVTTHEGAPAGVARERRRDDLAGAVGEAAAVARANGSGIDADNVLALLDMLPAGMRTSMQRDADAGRPIEVEAVGGTVLRAAGRAGISVPVTARLVADLRRRYTRYT